MKIKRFFALCAAFSFVMTTNAVKVVFRLDDPKIHYNSVHDRVFQLFIEKGVPLSVAVIPCNYDENPCTITDTAYWKRLNAPNIEIALHGLTHEIINNNGEFGSLSAEETYRRFHKGKEILEHQFEKPIYTFIAPFHATNPSFPKNLEANGLLILSADIYSEFPNEGNIQYYPETLGYLIKKKGIWNAAKESIVNCNLRDAICVICFHSYNLPDSIAWQQLEELLDYCNSSGKVELHTFSSLYASGESSSWLRYRVNQLSRYPRMHILQQGVLHPIWICLLVLIGYVLLHIAIAISGLLILLYYANSLVEKRCIWGASVFIGIVIGCFAWFNVLSAINLLSVSVLLNIFPMIYYLRKKHRKIS